MALANIIDNRKRRYRSCPINAVIEPSCADNDQPHADQYDVGDPSITTSYEERHNTSVYLAVNWANTFNFPVTLFLYDFDDDEEQAAEKEAFVKDFSEALARSEGGD